MGSRIGAEKGAATKCGVSYEEWLRRRANGESWCYCCRSWKPVAEFNKDPSRLNGLSSACRGCVSFKATASRHGIEVEAARKLRGGTEACEICGRVRKLEVDHCHATGAVRGMLCGPCNKALGLFRDSLDVMRKAIRYVQNRGRGRAKSGTSAPSATSARRPGCRSS